ncbi:alpha/beta fold hydrolase [Paraferrimonas sedimenticola]|uniref:AB hydrolase-1 domain-containing protein n=1 Tax=Paraferrimonas sedimenticola TaxID=375674 RepID=A0AA37VTQ4_9GAMM|nr:alpha/beta fold hydrolase [Paraferrimonas sedimenticola]GLP95499.1 hypothetical protein GCM10007895_08050 [Paraferrimonas sedimenticola]
MAGYWLPLALLLASVGAMPAIAAATTKAEAQELIVLAHGLGRGDKSMWMMRYRLEKSGYKVCRLDYRTIGVSVQQVLEQTRAQIDACLTSHQRVHFVGHSMGGLVITSYLNHRQLVLPKGQLGEVVLVGTPSHGSEVADWLEGGWLMQLGGGAPASLSSEAIAQWQKMSQIDWPVGVIAGTKSSPLTKHLFTHANDGLVSVESTKVASMKDFIRLKVGHAAMRYSEDVSREVVHFIEHGYFSHDN